MPSDGPNTSPRSLCDLVTLLSNRSVPLSFKAPLKAKNKATLHQHSKVGAGTDESPLHTPESKPDMAKGCLCPPAGDGARMTIPHSSQHRISEP